MTSLPPPRRRRRFTRRKLCRDTVKGLTGGLPEAASKQCQVRVPGMFLGRLPRLACGPCVVDLLTSVRGARDACVAGLAGHLGESNCGTSEHTLWWLLQLSLLLDTDPLTDRSVKSARLGVARLGRFNLESRGCSNVEHDICALGIFGQMAYLHRPLAGRHRKQDFFNSGQGLR